MLKRNEARSFKALEVHERRSFVYDTETHLSEMFSLEMGTRSTHFAFYPQFKRAGS